MMTVEFNVVVGMKATSVITFGDVDLSFAAVVMGNFDIDFGISVTAVRVSVAARCINVRLIVSK